MNKRNARRRGNSQPGNGLLVIVGSDQHLAVAVVRPFRKAGGSFAGSPSETQI